MPALWDFAFFVCLALTLTDPFPSLLARTGQENFLSMGERILVNKHKDNIFAYDIQADRCSWRGRKDGLPRGALRRAAVPDFTPLRQLTLCIPTLRLLKSNLTSIILLQRACSYKLLWYVVCKVCPPCLKDLVTLSTLAGGSQKPQQAAHTRRPVCLYYYATLQRHRHTISRGRTELCCLLGLQGEQESSLRAAHSSTHLQHEEELSPLRGTCQRLITLICQEHHQDSKGRSI